MSLGRNLELCARKVLRDYGVESEANAMKVLLRHENQTNNLARFTVNLQAIRAAVVSAKARTLRYRLEVIVRTAADIEIAVPPAAGQEPETLHAAKVDLCHKALDDQAPGLPRQHPILYWFNLARTTLDLQCTVLMVVPIGELEIRPKAGERAFYDGWGYLITCAEGVST